MAGTPDLESGNLRPGRPLASNSTALCESPLYTFTKQERSHKEGITDQIKYMCESILKSIKLYLCVEAYYYNHPCLLPLPRLLELSSELIQKEDVCDNNFEK